MLLLGNRKEKVKRIGGEGEAIMILWSRWHYFFLLTIHSWHFYCVLLNINFICSTLRFFKLFRNLWNRWYQLVDLMTVFHKKLKNCLLYFQSHERSVSNDVYQWYGSVNVVFVTFLPASICFLRFESNSLTVVIFSYPSKK